MLGTLYIVLFNPHNNPGRYYAHFAEEEDGALQKERGRAVPDGTTDK